MNFGPAMPPLRLAAALLCLTVAGGCSDSENGSGVGGVSPGEARALNEAAEMLDSRPAPPEQPLTNGPGN